MVGAIPSSEPPKEALVPGKQCGNVAKESFLQFLDCEIDNLRSERERPGWTTWALLAALGTVLWLILDVVQGPGVTFWGAAAAFFLICVLVYALAMFYHAIGPGFVANRAKEGRFWFWEQRYGQSRPQIMLAIVKSSSLMVLALLLDNAGLLWYHKFVLCSMFGSMAALLLVAFVLSFAKIPISTDPDLPTRASRILGLVFGVVLIWPVAVSVVQMVELPTGPSVPEWRLGGLVYALVFVLGKVLDMGGDRSILVSLIEIRRSCVLGRIDQESAMRQAEIALIGMNLSDVMAGNLSSVIKLYEEAAQEFCKTVAYYEAIKAMAPNFQNPLASEEESKVKVLLVSANQCREKAQAAFAKSKEESDRFFKRLRRIRGRGRAPESEWADLRQKMTDAMDSLGKRWLESDGKRNELKEKLIPAMNSEMARLLSGK